MFCRFLRVDSSCSVLRASLSSTIYGICADDVPKKVCKVGFLADCLMAAFAMFSLKETSLRVFVDRRKDQSLMNLYRIKSIPSDTQHRVIRDEVDPNNSTSAVSRRTGCPSYLGKVPSADRLSGREQFFLEFRHTSVGVGEQLDGVQGLAAGAVFDLHFASAALGRRHR